MCLMQQRMLVAACQLFAVVLALAGAPRASAHEGPPFPILMDEPAEDYVVSVWADPDIGEAAFYVIVETPSGKPPARAPEVSMWAEPVSGRLERAIYPMERRTMRNRMQFEAQPYFDQRDLWTIGFRLVSPGRRPGELTTEVESTPPGFGMWDLAIYLFPFLLLGGLWVMAMFRRFRAGAQQRERAAGAADAASRPAPASQSNSETAARPDLAAAGKSPGE